MAHAPYNLTVGVYFGPGTATPGVLKRTVQGRLVVNDWKTLPRPTAISNTSYVICEGPSLIAGAVTLAPPLVTIDTSKADVLEVPFGSGVFMTVIQCEVRRPRRGSTLAYNRAYVQ